MKNVTELEQEIQKTKEQLERLEKALDEAKNGVPDQLEWYIGEKYWVIDSIGNIIQYNCNEYTTSFDKSTHHMFKTKDYAKLYAEKTQFIADLLHFKWLYDRDYVPDWSSDKKEYKVYFNPEHNKYTTTYVWHDHNTEIVYFSTQEIAQKCADWLNSRRKEE